jgi:exonuclease III
MSRAFTPKVITANALLEGDAIWFKEDNTWSRNIAEAELITDEAHGDIRLLEAKADQSIVVGVYLAEAKKTNNGPAPTHFREAFRTRGPSNYSHGKQEA